MPIVLPVPMARFDANQDILVQTSVITKIGYSQSVRLLEPTFSNLEIRSVYLMIRLLIGAEWSYRFDVRQFNRMMTGSWKVSKILRSERIVPHA
jgi:hypothetical protein